jgi:hypothetical protein
MVNLKNAQVNCIDLQFFSLRNALLHLWVYLTIFAKCSTASLSVFDDYQNPIGVPLVSC